jgi:TatD DNase family protein
MIPLLKDLKGVIHCFTGDLDDLEKYLNLGFYIGFNGIIFKLNLDEVILKTPIDRILLETDCPYLGSSEARNEPTDIIRVAKRIAEIKGVDYDLLKEKTSENAKKLFLGAIQS